MADILDVENALVSLIAATVYPSGIGQPSAAGAIPCKVYAGWPSESQLDADLLIGTAHITVYPSGPDRNTTRYTTDWQELSVAAATITATIVGQTINIGGVMPSPFAAHNVSIKVNGKYYVYAVQPSDTLTVIATALAALLVADYPGTANAGPVITVAAAGRIASARVGTTGTMIRELRRQERLFQITIWANTPDNRKTVASVVDVGLAATEFLVLSDTTGARLVYKSSMDNDSQQKSKLYRRDLLYLVEYATTQTVAGYQVTQETLGLGPAFENMAAPVSTVTVNL